MIEATHATTTASASFLCLIPQNPATGSFLDCAGKAGVRGTGFTQDAADLINKISENWGVPENWGQASDLAILDMAKTLPVT